MVWDLIYPTDPEAKPATICVCGSGAMSRDIFCAFAYISISFGKAKTDEETENLLKIS